MGKKFIRWIGLAAGIALCILLRGMLGRFALLLLAAATIAYLLHPLQHMLTVKLRVSGAVSSVMAFAAAALGLGILAGFGVPALARQTALLGQSAPQLMEGYMDALQRLVERFKALGLPAGLLETLRLRAGDLLAAGAGFMAEKLYTVVRGVSRLGYLVFAPVLAYYMLRDRAQLFGFLAHLVPRKQRRGALRVGKAVSGALAAYVRGQVTVSCITAAVTALGLLVQGVRAWLLLGAVMLLCNLIPYFGPWLGAIPIALFAAERGIVGALGGLAAVAAAQLVEGLFVSPRVIGRAASLHPALVILSLIAGGWVAGLPGMFYAIPAVLSLRAAAGALRDLGREN